MIPGLTDHEIPSILKAAREAGASAAGMILLRLPWGVKDLFRERLESYMPDRAGRVLNRIRETRSGRLNDPEFKTRMGGTGTYAGQIRELFKVTSRREGLERRALDLSMEGFRRPAPPARTGKVGASGGGKAQGQLELHLE